MQQTLALMTNKGVCSIINQLEEFLGHVRSSHNSRMNDRVQKQTNLSIKDQFHLTVKFKWALNMTSNFSLLIQTIVKKNPCFDCD